VDENHLLILRELQVTYAEIENAWCCLCIDPQNSFHSWPEDEPEMKDFRHSVRSSAKCSQPCPVSSQEY